MNLQKLPTLVVFKMCTICIKSLSSVRVVLVHHHFSMTALHIPGLLTQNFTASVRLLGLVGLFILIFMWETAVMTNSSKEHIEEKYNRCFVRRTAQKDGFHREITTVLIIPENVLPNIDKKNGLQIFIKEYLPPGLYVDLYQSKATQEFGGPQVYSGVDIDVEKPAHLSPAHTVQVFTELTKRGHLYHSKVTLPIHIRYHRPSAEHSHHQIHLHAPEIFLNVTDGPTDGDSGLYEQYVCDASGHMKCTWQKLKCDFEPEDGMLEFNVPVGQTQHRTAVLSLTLVITVLSTLFLAYSMISKKQPAAKRN